MDSYKVWDIEQRIEGNPYVGRGIVLGKTPDGRHGVAAFFIMGRSKNSRNRIFVERDGALFTEPFDAAAVEDPSLIIYAAARRYKNRLIVTNGDQTDTVYEGLSAGKSFHEALQTRAFEPDAPNFTPRISGMMTLDNGDCTYEMSILKSVDAHGSACQRFTFSYPSVAGLGHFLHTYVGDGNPLPPFFGEPERVKTCDDIDAFSERLWNALNEDNRISLYVCYTDLKSGATSTTLFNKNR